MGYSLVMGLQRSTSHNGPGEALTGDIMSASITGIMNANATADALIRDIATAWDEAMHAQRWTEHEDEDALIADGWVEKFNRNEFTFWSRGDEWGVSGDANGFCFIM